MRPAKWAGTAVRCDVTWRTCRCASQSWSATDTPRASRKRKVKTLVELSIVRVGMGLRGNIAPYRVRGIAPYATMNLYFTPSRKAADAAGRKPIDLDRHGDDRP